MWMAVAVSIVLADYAIACAMVARVRPRSAALVAPTALAMVIWFEAIVLELLSAAHAVTRTGVLIAHAVPVAIALLMSPRRTWDGAWAIRRRASATLARLGKPGLLVLPLFVILVLSATRYAPNNWDSMTYHLARVAHWIQNQSIAPYPTNIPRQVQLGPGAEYLLLVLQVVSGSDRLANFLQLFCWVLLVVSAGSLARLAGAPSRLSRLACLFVAGMPMALLQATSTQNDLVAAVLAVAIVAASTPFLHATHRRWRVADVLLLGVVGAASLLVKPFAIVAAFPLILLAGAGMLVTLARASRGRVAGLAALAVGAALSLPVAHSQLRSSVRATAGDVRIFSDYVFPLRGDWGARALNVVRGAAHHVVLPEEVASMIGVSDRQFCAPSGLCVGMVLVPHEDWAGNPVNAALIVLLLGAGVLAWRHMTPRTRYATLTVIASWLVFHLFVRENPWVSRLQTPLFVLAVTSLGVLGRRRAYPAARGLARTVQVTLLILLVHGYSVALANASRPPLGTIRSREDTYYTNRHALKPSHDAALGLLDSTGCRRLGLYIGGDSWDYPLTWRAMQRGVEVRHVVGSDAWPCVVFADGGPPPPPPGATAWETTAERGLFVRAGHPGP